MAEKEVEEEIQEVVEKPESMLSTKTQQVLIEVIDRETERALKEGDDAQAMELQRAKKLVKKGCYSIRKANPFLNYMESCLLGDKGDLKATQETMKKCGEEWNKLGPEDKRKFRTQERDIYDYL